MVRHRGEARRRGSPDHEGIRHHGRAHLNGGQMSEDGRQNTDATSSIAFGCRHPSSDIWHLSSVICHLSSVICHLSSVICHLSSVICHLKGTHMAAKHVKFS